MGSFFTTTRQCWEDITKERYPDLLPFTDKDIEILDDYYERVRFVMDHERESRFLALQMLRFHGRNNM